MTEQKRADVLDMIDRGELSAEEGLRILDAMKREVDGPAPALPGAAPVGPDMLFAVAAEAPGVSATEAEPDILPPRPPAPTVPSRFRYAWLVLAGSGLVVAAGFGLAFSGLWSAGWFGALMAVLCVSPFALLGLGLALVGVLSARAPWAHVRVDTGQKEWPRKINISVPLPLRPVGWMVRVFGRFTPALARTAVDDVLEALSAADFRNEPVVIDVHEGEGGERIQVVVG